MEASTWSLFLTSLHDVFRLTPSRTHVFRDLMPYVCTFNDCTDDLFRTRHEWFRHELEFHRRQWICHLCKSSFTRPSLIESHFREAHPGRIADDRVQATVSRASRPLENISSSSCAFCDDWKMPPGKTDETMELCRHVGRHQEHLALDAIPRHLDDLVIIEEDQGPETHDLQSDGLSTLEENVETGSPTRSRGSELAPQDQRHSISIQADRSFSQKVWVRQEGGKSKIMTALLKAALPFNIITTINAKRFNMGPAKDARVARNANLTSIGDVSLTHFVTAFISASENDFREEKLLRVDFYLLPGEFEQLSAKPLAEAVLGHQFISAMTNYEHDGPVEDPAKATGIVVQIPAYRLPMNTLKQFLEDLFGAQEFEIVVSSHPKRLNIGTLNLPSPPTLRLSDTHGVETRRCVSDKYPAGFKHCVFTPQKLLMPRQHAFQVPMY